MADPKLLDAEMEEEYDEEADSDFDAGTNDEVLSSSSEDEEGEADTKTKIGLGKRKQKSKPIKITPLEDGLDSGDEAALAEYRKEQKRSKKKGEVAEDDTDKSDEGWRARTRGMREREQVEKKKRRPLQAANITIDVEKIWEEMNRPGAFPAPVVISQIIEQTAKPDDSRWLDSKSSVAQHGQEVENVPPIVEEEKITIRRTFKFAGEITTEEKVVPKSSAEARLWLSQQGNQPEIVAADGRTIRRPLRRISRFDPNSNNLDAFKISWSALRENEKVKAKKINVVDKSKQDWAADVDQTGDREELEKHAKSKRGYLGQQDTLSRLAQARDDTRTGRPKG